MSEKNDIISRRRVFSLLGLAAALGFAIPAEVLTPSDAEAQAPTPAPAPSPAPAPNGGRSDEQAAPSGVRNAARVARNGERSAAQPAPSDGRSGAEVAKPNNSSSGFYKARPTGRRTRWACSFSSH